jgi:hypothetical protein
MFIVMRFYIFGIYNREYISIVQGKPEMMELNISLVRRSSHLRNLIVSG